MLTHSDRLALQDMENLGDVETAEKLKTIARNHDELLSALELAELVITEVGYVPTSNGHAALMQIRAAIAKARGQQ